MLTKGRLRRLVWSAAAVVSLVAASRAIAQPPSRSPQREKSIEQQLAAVAPAAVAIFQQATIALDKQQYADAVRLYREVINIAPRFSPAVRRLAFSLDATGNVAEGLKAAEQAVQLERSPENLGGLAALLARLEDKQETSVMAREQALRLAKEAAAASRRDDDPDYLILAARIAWSLQRTADFRDAVKTLVDKYPREPITHFFAAILAANDSQWIRADDEAKEAERLGLPHDAVANFLDSGVHWRATVQRSLSYGLYPVIAWCAGLAILFLAGKILSAQTLRSIEDADPDGSPTPREVSLRGVYRKLIRFAGMYYYVSLPIVIVFVLGGTAGVIYMFMLLGRIPIRLVAVLGIGALVTSYKMIQSLFIRVDSEDPGRVLELAEAPGLWSLTRRVADTVGTRPIDEIRVTPGTEIAVYERGSAREQASDQGRRILVLGVGLLDEFAQAPFCAVLAHEYGHFSHRDTAGGEVALRVRQDMIKFANAMVEHGQAVWWNLAFQFLRLYSFLFRRISHGATRLQEVLADRLAARHYSAKHFEDGLRHVVRRSIEFNTAAQTECQEALQARRALHNLYALRVPATAAFEQEVADALSRATSEDDTHPGPLERFRLLSRMRSTGDSTAAGMVWDLFANRDRLTTEMTAVIDSHVKLLAESGFVPD